jgi:DNA anti-recombination protein RmuC
MSADLEQRVTNLEKFAADVREFTAFLRDVIRRYDERLDEHENLFREADEKIAALADAQIRTEAAMRHTDGQIAALVDAQIKTGDALQRLADAVAQHTADGHGGHG